MLRSVRAAASEIWGLFVDDGALAIATVAVLLAIAVFLDHESGFRGLAGAFLVIGVFLAIAVSLSGTVRQGWTRGKASEAAAAVEAVLEDRELPKR